MKRHLCFAFWMIGAVCGPGSETTLRAQDAPAAPGARGRGFASESGPRGVLRRPEPTVIADPSPGVQAPLAMLGYSPVSVIRTRQWVKGRESYKVVVDGAAYWLADRREMQMFSASPERFLPVLGGDCVVHLVHTGERRPGLVRHGVVYEDRLFFFSSSEHKQAFVENPQRYADADLALGGNCPVSLVELNKEVPGQRALAAVLGGYRYLFPGAQQREMFLAQPRRYAAAAHAIAGSGLPAPIPTAEGRAPRGGAANATPPADEMAAAGAGTSRPSERDTARPQSASPRGDLPAPVPTALSGYCPVSILDDSRWVRGNPEYAVVHDGRRYLLAGGPQQQAFVEDLLRYVPALGGDCVVSFKDEGERVEGSVFHAVIHRGRQYLFSGPQQKEAFKENPDAYADVDLALAGLCPVSLVETGQEIAGNPELTAWYNGLRFQLAGREKWESFQKAPRKYALEASARMEESADRPSQERQETLDNPFE